MSIILADATLRRFVQLRHVVSAYVDRLEKMREGVFCLVRDYAQSVYDLLPEGLTSQSPGVNEIIIATDWDECQDLTQVEFTYGYEKISLYGASFRLETPYLLCELTTLYRDYISEIVRNRIKDSAPQPTKRMKLCRKDDDECREFMNHRRFTEYY